MMTSKRSWRRVVISVVLVAVWFTLKSQAVRRLESAESTASARPAGEETSFFSLFFFGGFRPLYIESLWTKADRLFAEGRYWEVVAVFDRIARLDPKNGRVWLHLGKVMTLDIAQSEVERNERWRWFRKALSHVERGIANNPENFELRELRYWIYFDHIARDAQLDRVCKKVTGKDGLQGALEEVEEMRKRFPDRAATWGYYRESAEEAVLRLVIRAEFEAAARLAGRLIELQDEIGRRFPAAAAPAYRASIVRVVTELERAETFADWGVRGGPRPRGGADDAVAFLDDLEATWDAVIGDADGEPVPDTFAARAVLRIHQRLLNLCQFLVVGENHDLALPWVSRLRRIPAKAEGVDSRSPFYSATYVDHLAEFAKLDRDLVAHRKDGNEPAAELLTLWRERLSELSRLAREDLGRRDFLARTIERARALPNQD